MSRAAENQAKQTYQSASDFGKGATSNSNDLYSSLVPTFTNEASNPQGFGKTDLASMNTAAQQSEGGALGAAVGQANTMGAANRNSGSFAPALDEASRAAGRNLSNTSAGIAGENAKLKEAQRQEGISGLSGLQGEQNNNVLSSLGLQTNSTNALVNAGKSGWFQNMTDFMKAAGDDAKGAASLGMGFNQPSGQLYPGASEDDELMQLNSIGIR
jgi:hypothetical protein